MWALWMRMELQRALITIVNPPCQKGRTEGRQAVLWPQSQTLGGGILSNSKLPNFLLQSPYSTSLLGCQQFISIYSVT